MRNEWPFVKIEDVAERVAMGPFGSSIKVETFVSDGIPVISGQHLQGFKVNDEAGYNFITHEHAERLRKANVLRGDIIFTHAGNIGQVAYIPANSRFERYIISQRQFYMRPDTSRVIPEYIVAYFKTPEGQHKLLANTSQVGVPSIAQPVTYLRSIKIPLPPLAEQRAIAHILGTLDDKIELNRRMNETLEVIARAIFKSWFVDFDPVIDNAILAGNPIPSTLAEKAARRREMPARAKAEGRDSWFPKDIADLFPARFIDSDLGPIPEGWVIKTVGGEVEIVKGVSYRSHDLLDSEIALVTLKSFNRGGGYRPEGLKPYVGEYKKEQIIQPGELIVAQTDVTQAAEVIGKPALVLPDDHYKTLVASLDVLIIRPKSTNLPREFFYLLFLSSEFQEHIYGHTNGTTVLHLGKNGIPSFIFAKPPRPIAFAFSDFVTPQFKKIETNFIESRTLAALRDALLPKLISGELRVKDAEKFLKERGL